MDSISLVNFERSLLHSITCGLVAITCSMMTLSALAEEESIPPQKAPQIEFDETLRAELDPDLPDYQVQENLNGIIRLVGAETMRVPVQSWIDSFGLLYPQVELTLDAQDVTPGVMALVNGSADMIPIAREPSVAEQAGFEEALGYPPFAIEVGTGPFRKPGKSPAIVFYVNKANPVDRLTLPQLDAIISTSRRRGYPEDITTWGQLGATGDFAEAPIHIYSIKRPNGIPHHIELKVSLGGEFRPETIEMVSDSSIRVLFRMANAVSEDPYGIAYGSLLHLTPETKVVALASSAGDPFIEPTFDNVLSRAYPLARPLYLYINRAPGQTVTPLIREFLKYALSRQGQEDLVKDGIMLPLSPTAVEAELEKLEGT